MQAVKRNSDIFPDHFMFELTKEENDFLRSQIVTSKKGSGGHDIYQWYLQSTEFYNYRMFLEVKEQEY